MNTQDVKSFVQIKSNNRVKSNMEISFIKFQEGIFGLMFILLKEEEEPSWLFGFLMIFQTLQALTFPFSSVVIIII